LSSRSGGSRIRSTAHTAILAGASPQLRTLLGKPPLPAPTGTPGRDSPKLRTVRLDLGAAQEHCRVPLAVRMDRRQGGCGLAGREVIVSGMIVWVEIHVFRTVTSVIRLQG
jgi:hypothetical protein